MADSRFHHLIDCDAPFDSRFRIFEATAGNDDVHLGIRSVVGDHAELHALWKMLGKREIEMFLAEFA
jgi:hypothetical protein